MVLLFGQFPHAVGEGQRLAEIREFEFLLKVMLVDDQPAARQLLRQGGQIRPRQRRHAASAGDTLFFG